MKALKILGNTLEVFIVSLFVFLLTIFMIFRITLLNRNYISTKIQESQYITLEKSIKEEMKGSMISSGIENTIIDDMFDKRDIASSTRQILDILYYNYNKDFDTTTIQQKLEENIKNDLAQKNFILEEEKGYKEFVNSIMDIYRGEFIMLNQVSKVGKIIQKSTGIINIICIILAVLLSIILLIRRKRITHILPIAFYMTSILIIFGVYYINKEAGLTSITIISVSFSEIIRSIIHSIFTIYTVVAIIFFLLGTLIACMQKRPHHHHHHHHTEEERISLE